MKDVNILTSNGVNVNQSLELFGDMEMYDDTLKDFLDMIEGKLQSLENRKAMSDMVNYAIEVHALKSDARYLGFTTLADMSYESELKSKAGDIMFVQENHPKIMAEARRMINVAKQYLGLAPGAPAAPAAAPVAQQPVAQPAPQPMPQQMAPQGVMGQPMAQPMPQQMAPQGMMGQPMAQPMPAPVQPVAPQGMVAEPAPAAVPSNPMEQALAEQMAPQGVPQPTPQPMPQQMAPQGMMGQPMAQPMPAPVQPVQPAPVAPVESTPQVQFFPADNASSQVQFFPAEPAAQPMGQPMMQPQAGFAAPAGAPAGQKEGTILIVDDSSLVVNFVKKIFDSRYNVMIASDGAKAIELLDQEDIRKDIKACLLDLNMPNVDGYQVLEHCKQKGYFVRMPVAVESGVEDMASLDRVNAYPIVDVLSKPFNERDVQRVIEKCLATYF